MGKPALLCDIGNVLVRFDFSVAAQRLADLGTVRAGEILFQLEAIKGPFEAGAMDDASFVAAAVAALKFRGSHADFETIWCEIFSENEPMEQLLAPLAGRVPMLLLSNTSGLHKDYLWRTYPVFRLFQDGVYSYAARCSKPDPAIFQQAIDRFDLKPGDTLFIDDLAPNIETALRLGFDAFQYNPDEHAALEPILLRWRHQHGLA